MFEIRIHGLDRAAKYLRSLPEKVKKEIDAKSMAFVKFVQKSAKLRAPRDTGYLASQIRVAKFGNTIVLDTGKAYYAGYQEFGFRGHWVPIEYLEQKSRISGMPVLKPKGFAFVRGIAQPFIFPALKAGLNQLPNMLKDGVRKAIK